MYYQLLIVTLVINNFACYFYQLQDTGLVQLCSTERLKPYIQSEPVPIRNEHSTDVLSPNLVCHALTIRQLECILVYT